MNLSRYSNNLLLFTYLTLNTTITSRDLTLIELDSSVSLASAAASRPSLHNAFSQIIDLNRATPTFTTRDRYIRPTPTYNFNYNPYKPPLDT
jgi:hypothetical protein